MPDELLFTVVGSAARPAEPISLADAGLKERGDLQEWVLDHPVMLGSDVMIVTFEFDRWWASAGTAPADRLDVLGLGSDGQLVVAELKRDRAPDTTEMQAIKYAAMASRFTVEALAEQHARFREQHEHEAYDADEALARLIAHAPDLSDETLRKPRIVLLARDFPPVVTATVVWLTEMGLDITLQRFQAYRSTAPGTDDAMHTQVLVSVSQLYPVTDVEEFTVSPVQAQVRAGEATKKRTRDVSTVRRLVDAEAVADGTVFTINIRKEIDAAARATVQEWLTADPKRQTATWQNDASAPLRWDADGQTYAPSGLVRTIVREATGIDRSFYGTQWWREAEGRTLVELAAATGGRAEQYRAFWARFLDRVAAEHPDWSGPRTPTDQNWFDMPSPIKGTHYGHSFSTNQRLRTELYIDARDAGTTTQLFEALRERRAEIETRYGGTLTWEDLPGKRACRVADYTTGEIGKTDENEQYIDWFLNTGERLRRALNEVTPAARPVS